MYNTKDLDPLTFLSKREKEIFMLLLSGYRTKAIADKLHLKSNTISTVIKNLKAKTNTKTLIDLLNIGIKYGHTSVPVKSVDYKAILIEHGYAYLHAFEIGRSKRNTIIRFEYWTKGQMLFIAEVINGQCSTFFAQLKKEFWYV